VAAPEEAERPVIERLDAQGQAVDAGRPEGSEAGRLGRGRVGPITAPTVAGAISEGVPPPKKMLVTVRPLASPAKWSISASSAAPQRAWSMRPRTWLLKSQYGHLDRQKGQCT
jgi:hypothetical protein